MSPTAHSERRATLSALAALALWGSLAALVIHLRGVPPFLLLAISLGLGGLVGLRRGALRAVSVRSMALGIWGLFAYHLCLFLALRTAPAVEANLLNYLWPLLLVVLSPIFLPGTRLAPRHLLGAAMGFGGAAWLMTGGTSGFGGGAGGYLLAVAAAVIWASYSLLTKRLGDFPTSAVALFCLASAALALLCHLLLEPRTAIATADVPYLIAVGLGPLGASFYFWDRAMKDGDPRVIGALAYLTPLLSTSLVAATGGGRLTAHAAIAGVLIVGGAVVGRR